MTRVDSRKSVLVTGAAGVVGSALVGQLYDRHVYAMYRRKPGPQLPNVTWVQGDTTEPNLGFGERYADILCDIESVVHMAAIVDFNAGADVIRAVNELGTAHVVSAACAANADLVHVSSCFVERRGLARRVTGSSCADGRDAYLNSKVAGERIVAESGLPHRVLRLSLIMGDSATGEVSRRQGLHTMMGAIIKGMVPAKVLPDDAIIDFLPQDIAANAVAAALKTAPDGRTYTVAAGANALRIGTMTEIATRVRREHGCPDITVRYVSLDTIQRLWPAFVSEMSDRHRVLFENMLGLSSLFSDAEFDSDLGQGALTGVEAPSAVLEATVERTIRRYWVPKRAGKRVLA